MYLHVFIFLGLSECQRKRKDLETGPPLVGAYKPQCNKDGTYRRVQCHSSTGYCWCASPDGTEWPGTRVREIPECSEKKSKLCVIHFKKNRQGCRILLASIGSTVLPRVPCYLWAEIDKNCLRTKLKVTYIERIPILAYRRIIHKRTTFVNYPAISQDGNSLVILWYRLSQDNSQT